MLKNKTAYRVAVVGATGAVGAEMNGPVPRAGYHH
jgi:hypothetical protein